MDRLGLEERIYVWWKVAKTWKQKESSPERWRTYGLVFEQKVNTDY